jgi:N-succinyldiaminopimelate aminotransferase
MPVAHRLAPFGATVFAEITRLAIEHGAVNLGQGFPDFDGPEPVRRAAADALLAGPNQYPPTNGVPDLQRALADHWRAHTGDEIDPAAQVTVTSGCTEAIAATLLGLLNPGDEVILFEPFYDSYRACLAMAGATPRFVTLDWPDFRLDPAALRAAVTDRTRAILINTPHNPTGRAFCLEELTAVAELCVERDLVAITDEVYEHLVYEGEHIRLATLPGMESRTITMSSMGKTFSLTGWKIGWAIASPDLSRAVRAAHQFLTFTVPPALQIATAHALDAHSAYYERLRVDLTRRRDQLCDALTDLGFPISRPASGYFVIADHTPFGFEDDLAFSKHLIESVGVAAIPPSSFYEANPAAGRKLIRFAFCKKQQTLDEAITRLRKLRT